MHPLRVLLLASLVVALFVAAAFGWSLYRNGVSNAVSILVAAAVFAAFLVPWAGVSLWALRRANGLDRLIDLTREIVEARPPNELTARPYHGELDDLARGLEELRVALAREKAWAAEQRSTMEQIAAALGEGLLALDPRGRIVLANERVAEMFGSSEPPVGRSFLQVARQQPLIAAFDQALRGTTTSTRIEIDTRQIEIRVFPVASSTDVAAVALFIDITQIERLQRIRKDFLDDFSHEVRTPLAGLRSAVESFDEGDLTREQEEQLRHVMTRQLIRIERLVKDLSELNRIESGELVLERRPVDLRDLLRDLADELRERVAQITVSGNGAAALADPERAQQIFSNLLDNAWKHGGGGEIVVDVGSDGNDVVVSVSDKGAGIPPADLQRIFNRFYRVDKSRSQSVPGVGLGLSIAKHLVLLHGGSIRAYNRAEGGATFEVRLPAAQ